MLKEKFLIRTGISGEEADLVKHFFKKFWLGHVAKQFGYGAPWFLLLSFYKRQSSQSFVYLYCGNTT